MKTHGVPYHNSLLPISETYLPSLPFSIKTNPQQHRLLPLRQLDLHWEKLLAAANGSSRPAAPGLQTRPLLTTTTAGMEGTGSSPGPISEAQRHDLQQRLFDNFNALLFHREVQCQLDVHEDYCTLSAAGTALTHMALCATHAGVPAQPCTAGAHRADCSCRGSQGLPACGEFVVVAPEPTSHTATASSSCTQPHADVCACTGARGRAGHEQQADGADVCQGGCDAAAGRGGALHAATGGACRRLPQRQQRRHAAAVPQRVQWRPAQHTDRAQPAAQAQQAPRRCVGVAGPG